MVQDQVTELFVSFLAVNSFCRPPALGSVTLGQLVSAFDAAKPGREEMTRRELPRSPVCHAKDLPPIGGVTHLPSIVHCSDGTVLRRRRVPAALNWAPRTAYADILLFTVSPGYYCYINYSLSLAALAQRR